MPVPPAAIRAEASRASGADSTPVSAAARASAARAPCRAASARWYCQTATPPNPTAAATHAASAHRARPARRAGAR